MRPSAHRQRLQCRGPWSYSRRAECGRPGAVPARTRCRVKPARSGLLTPYDGPVGVERHPLFARMYTAGERLIEAQKAEENLCQLYSMHRTPQRLEYWKSARLLVEELAEEYLRAIREYRRAVEIEATACV